MNWKKAALAAALVVAAVAAFVLAQEPAVIAWMKTTSYEGAPRWAWLALVGLFVGDWLLLRVNNPRARAVAEVVPNLIALLVGKFGGMQAAGEWIARTFGSPPPPPKLGDVVPITTTRSSALLPLLLLPALLALGCAGGLNGVRESLTASATLLQASADSFKAVDLTYQRSLETKPDPAYEIGRYRTITRPKIMKAFVDAAAALSLGQATCAAVEQGAKSKGELGTVMVQVFDELKAVQEALAAIGLLPASSMRPRPPRRYAAAQFACALLSLGGVSGTCRELAWLAGGPEGVL